MGLLKRVGRCAEAFYAPVYAIFQPSDEVHRPDPFDAQFWWVTATILSIAFFIQDLWLGFFGWSKGKWEAVAVASWICFVACRFALVEREVAEVKKMKAHFTQVERDVAEIKEQQRIEQLQRTVQGFPTIRALRAEGRINENLSVLDLVGRLEAEGKKQEASRILDDLARDYRESGILKDLSGPQTK